MINPKIGQIWQIVQLDLFWEDGKPASPHSLIGLKGILTNRQVVRWIFKQPIMSQYEWYNNIIKWDILLINGVTLSSISEKWIRHSCILLEDVNGKHKPSTPKPS